jgi:hypothetical protein
MDHGGRYIIPGVDIAIKLSSGEDLTMLDLLSEVVGIVPIGKVFSAGFKAIAKVGDEVIDITKQVQTLFKAVCGCFTEGTLVLTEDGQKKIEEIEVGDLVWAYDEDIKAQVLKEVVSTFAFERTIVYKIYLGEEIIEATEDHPFFVGGNWVKVKDLKVGSGLTSYTGGEIKIDKIEKVSGELTVYNFEVEDVHTYFVGNKHSVLVHNQLNCAIDLRLGSNTIAHFKKHAQQIRSLANRLGYNGQLGKKVGSNPATQQQFTDFNQWVVNQYDEFGVGRWGDFTNARWHKKGDALVLTQMDGTYITTLDYASTKFTNATAVWDDVVITSYRIVNINKPDNYMELNQVDTWEPQPDWHPDWADDWCLEKLKLFAQEITKNEPSCTVLLDIEAPGGIFFEVFYHMGKIAEVFVSPGGYEDDKIDPEIELTYTIYAGIDEEELHQGSIEVGIEFIKSFWAKDDARGDLRIS